MSHSTAAGATPDRTVLVVDDSPEDAEHVMRLLRRAPSVSYRVRQVEYGRDVLTAIAELRPDCILLDHHLPDCTGLDVLDALAREHGAIPVPVIMLTGSHVLIGTAVSAMQRGAMDYIAKENVTATLLYRAIENAIARFTDAKLLEAQRQELERRNRALDAAADRTARLLALATQLGAATTPPEVARAALAELLSATRAMGGAVLAIDESGGGLDVLDAAGLSPEHVRLWRRGPLTRDAADAATLRGGEPLWLERRADIELRYPTLAAVAAAGARSAVEALALLPLVMNSRVAGELVVAWQEPRTLPAEERAFLLTASRLVGQAVERARLLHTTQRALRDAEKARAEAESANALKSKFLATMSHELRTPLNAISGYVDLLELGVRGPLNEPQRDDLGRVRRAQQHLLALINDVLDFARIESGRVDFRMASMSVAEELATVHALIAPQAAARALELLVDVPAPPAEIPRVVADADRVRQILLNLMSNAVKFTPPGGTVTVRVRRDGDMALVQVEDTGIGIERDQLEAIFEPFVQVDGTLTRTREGTGLGLAISRELARGMGGDLTVRSRPGTGSTFTLAMPVETAG